MLVASPIHMLKPNLQGLNIKSWNLWKVIRLQGLHLYHWVWIKEIQRRFFVRIQKEGATWDQGKGPNQTLNLLVP